MRLERLLSLGHSVALPDRLARRIRVTNALALLGLFLAVTGTPLDVIGRAYPLVIIDAVSVLLFVSCLSLNARGHRMAARVVLMSASNLVILGGIVSTGADAEIRAMCFPLVLMPFLVFDTTERVPLTVFVVIPIAAYFTASRIGFGAATVVQDIYIVYAPVLSFVMIVSGTYVFAAIDRSADEKLLHTRARAATSARLAALGELSSGIAHEVRNPLAAIHLAATQIGERPTETAQVVHLAERISRIVMRASKIIETLRAFARDASSDPFAPAPVQRIVADTLELCGKRVAEHGVELMLPPIAPDLVVECRAMQLSQVLMNLIVNAYDAVDKSYERWVRIEARALDKQVEISVTDSGTGVATAMQSRIFEPFFTTKPVDQGTGLGLSLSRDLVEAHHGTLTLDSESTNTRFVMRLPKVQPQRVAVV